MRRVARLGFVALTTALTILAAWLTAPWFDAHAGAATGLATIALVMLTLYYAVQTRRQAAAAAGALEEMRLARLAESASYVTVDVGVRWGEWMFTLAIRNVGRSPAHNVSV